MRPSHGKKRILILTDNEQHSKVHQGNRFWDDVKEIREETKKLLFGVNFSQIYASDSWEKNISAALH